MGSKESLFGTLQRLRLESDRGAPFRFEQGLADDEFARIEGVIGVAFPRDLRALLSEALPVSNKPGGFPEWRSASPQVLRKLVDSPTEELLWSIDVNKSWPRNWGDRPDALHDALSVARAELAKAPPLIPVYGHRYLPASPARDGNPVFSIAGFDVIYYGSDLANYLDNEFLRDTRSPLFFAETPRYIEFWSDLAES